MAKSVNPKKQVRYLLKADQKIQARREYLASMKNKVESGEVRIEPPTPDKNEAPEVLDPTWRPTVFICTHLTSQEQAHVQDTPGLGQTILGALDFGLAGVEDFPDENGSPIKFERDTDKSLLYGKRPWKRECLDRIDPVDRDEVASFILKGCKLEGSEAKNS